MKPQWDVVEDRKYYTETINEVTTFNLVLLGGGECGAKSSFANRYLFDQFSEEYFPTIENVYETDISIGERDVAMKIIDLPGQDELWGLGDFWVEESDVFSLGYAITRKSDLGDVSKNIERLRNVCHSIDIPVVLVGAKMDLEDQREVFEDDINAFLVEHGLENVKRIEISNKTGENVTKAIELLRDTYLEYWGHTRSSSKEYKFNFLKVMIVGEEDVGKTALRHGLQKLKYRHNQSTDGIDISTYHTKESGTLSIYDFGGQEVYYPTHNFFLTGEAVVILVFNIMKPDFERIEYWLQVIQSMGCAKHMILVATHIDMWERNVITKESIEDRIYSMKGSRIDDLYYLSTKTPALVKKFRAALLRNYTSHLLDNRETVPEEIKIIYEDLQNFDYLWMDQFEELCNDKGVMNHIPVAKYLHKVGSLIWFENTSLSDIIITNPNWLSKQFSKLVSFTVAWDNGIVKKEIIDILWKEEPELLKNQILDIMIKFNIIVDFPGEMRGAKYLVPSMFNLNPSPLYEELFEHIYSQPHFTRYYQLDFVPLGFFARIIFHLILEGLNVADQKDLYWQNGIVVTSTVSSEMAVLQFNRNENKITLFCSKSTEKISRSQILPKLSSSIITGLEEVNYEGNLDIYAACEVDDSLVHWQRIVDGYIEGEIYINCPSGHHDIRLVEIAPDACLEHLPQINYNDVVQGKYIAQGAFGEIYRGTYLNLPCAIKFILDKSNDAYTEFSHEVYIMSKLDHPCIVKLYGITNRPLSIVMELCITSMFHLLYRMDYPISDLYKLKVTYNLINGIEFLHSLKPPIIHRDLRSPNIFISSLNDQDDVVAKIGDFGLAHITTSMKATLASWQYLAPEVLDNAVYDERSDLYSFGMLTYEIYNRKMPFDEYERFVKIRKEYLSDEQLSNESFISDLESKGIKIDYGSKQAILEEWDFLSVKDEILNQHLRPTTTNIPEFLKEILVKSWDYPENRIPAGDIKRVLEFALESQ